MFVQYIQWIHSEATKSLDKLMHKMVVFHRLFYDWIYVGFTKIRVINLSEVCARVRWLWSNEKKDFCSHFIVFEFLFLFQWHSIYLYALYIHYYTSFTFQYLNPLAFTNLTCFYTFLKDWNMQYPYFYMNSPFSGPPTFRKNSWTTWKCW